MLKAIIAKNWFVLLFISILIFSLAVRIYQLDEVPPSPYFEEVALGYDAYSILQTGKDHHGNLLPIVAFESFGDFKPSLYFYVSVPFVKFFGLNVWAVRLPAALSGIFTSLGCSYLVYLLFLKVQGKRTASFLALGSLLLTGINPWLLQFSRGAWEISLATALITWGVVSWILAVNRVTQGQKAVTFFILTGLLFGLSMYAQHSARLVAPLLGVWLIVWSCFFVLPKTQLKNFLIQSLVTALTALIVILPIIKVMFSSQVQQRFNETSIFTNLSVIEKSNQYRELNHYSLVSRVFYHRYLLFGQEILGNFLTHFSLSYLFLSGDSNPRHSTQFFGLFYHLDLILLALGVFYLGDKKRNLLWLTIGWLVISLLPASISTGAPHALRTLPGFGAWVILFMAGWLQIFIFVKKFKQSGKTLGLVIFAGLLIAYLGEFIWFGKFYLQIYPGLYANEWQYGYKQMIEVVEKIRANYPTLPIYITREQGRPAMYYWFYTKADPRLVQQTQATVQKDQGEFLSWQNINYIDRADQIQPGEFILVSSSKFLLTTKIALQSEVIKILAPQGEIVWQVGRYQK